MVLRLTAGRLVRPLARTPGSSPDALFAGMFPMAPFANCIRDNRFAFGGRVWSVKANMAGARLNFHGSAWRSAWRVAAADAQSAELTLDDGRVDEVYRYAATQRFGLEPDEIAVETELVNRGDARMPFTFGQHPWFPVHAGALVRFAASSLWLCDADGQAERQVPIPPEADYATPRPPSSGYRNVCYAGWDGQVDIAWPSDGVTISMVADSILGNLMLHAPADGEPVFCLEPQTAAPCAFDGLESSPAPGVHILEPGGRVSGRVLFVIHN